MSMRNVYRKIAKQHGVTIKEVKQDMQSAIDYAYQKQDKSDAQQEKQERVPRRGAIPTSEELVRHMARQIKKQ